MKTFKVTELGSRADDLVRDAAAGQLSLIIKDGLPACVAVPFTEELLREGLGVSLAVKLFDEDVISLREGAQMARMSLAGFMAACSGRGVPVVRYSPTELEGELANIQRIADRG